MCHRGGGELWERYDDVGYAFDARSKSKELHHRPQIAIHPCLAGNYVQGQTDVGWWN